MRNLKSLVLSVLVLFGCIWVSEVLEYHSVDFGNAVHRSVQFSYEGDHISKERYDVAAMVKHIEAQSELLLNRMVPNSQIVRKTKEEALGKDLYKDGSTMPIAYFVYETLVLDDQEQEGYPVEFYFNKAFHDHFNDKKIMFKFTMDDDGYWDRAFLEFKDRLDGTFYSDSEINLLFSSAMTFQGVLKMAIISYKDMGIFSHKEMGDIYITAYILDLSAFNFYTDYVIAHDFAGYLYNISKPLVLWLSVIFPFVIFVHWFLWAAVFYRRTFVRFGEFWFQFFPRLMMSLALRGYNQNFDTHIIESFDQYKRKQEFQDMQKEAASLWGKIEAKYQSISDKSENIKSLYGMYLKHYNKIQNTSLDQLRWAQDFLVKLQPGVDSIDKLLSKEKAKEVLHEAMPKSNVSTRKGVISYDKEDLIQVIASDKKMKGVDDTFLAGLSQKQLMNMFALVNSMSTKKLADFLQKNKAALRILLSNRSSLMKELKEIKTS